MQKSTSHINQHRRMHAAARMMTNMVLLIKKSWQLDVWPLFIWIHEVVCSSSMDPEPGFRGVHHQVAALLLWHGPGRWCGTASPHITSSWSRPEGGNSAGQPWLVLPAKPGINSHQLPQGEERLTELRSHVAGLNICHVCGWLAWYGITTQESLPLKFVFVHKWKVFGSNGQ